MVALNPTRLYACGYSADVQPKAPFHCYKNYWKKAEKLAFPVAKSKRIMYKYLTKEEIEDRLEIEDDLFHGRISAKKLNFHTACNIFSENLDEIIASERSNITDALNDKKVVPRNRLEQLKKLYAHQRALKNPKRGRINSAMTATAKEYPIKDLYVGKLQKNGNRYIGTCPFHNEKNQSFFIYTNDNHYHCFGCHAHGDSIKFYMETNKGVSFPQAVKYLSGFYT